MNLTILTCNYNTPDLVDNLFRSIKKHCKQIPDLVVMNTGEVDFISERYYNYPNTPHGPAVNLDFNLINTKYLLLIDSDVLILKDFITPFNRFKETGAVLMGEVQGDRGGKLLYPRVNPCFCFLDLDQLKKHNIIFYDEERTNKSKKNNSPLQRLYDIGSTMFEDILKKDFFIINAMMENKYYKHYEGMSWRIQKYDPYNGDTDIDVGGTHSNKALYEYGLKVREEYYKDIKNTYEDINKISN